MQKFKLRASALGAAALLSTATAADVKATMIIYLDPSVQFFNPTPIS